MFNKLKEKVVQFVGEVAYFFGSVMADGFEDRMQAIAEEAEAEMDRQEAEANKFPDIKVN